jgi:chromosome segregation ATPase
MQEIEGRRIKMQIKISNLKLKNFKGIKNLEINFEGKNANIYGKNATGKTTVFDAFKWLFFDKDSSDRKDFNIKTLDENNKPIHFLEHEVEAILLIDGVDMTFKKMLKEKWVTKRGETQQEFSGHETSYWIDEVPVKKKDYEEKINSLVPESLFKLITDPLYFNKQLKWQERREILTNISGNQITDEEILNANEEFKTLQQNLNGRSIEDYNKVVASKIKDLNKEKEKIPIRIDELTNTLITEHDINYEELEKEKANCKVEIQKIDAEMTDIQTRAKENMKKADQLAAAKNELNTLKLKLETEHSKQQSEATIKLESEKAILESRKRNLAAELEERKQKVENAESSKQELYKKWDELLNTKLEFDPNSFICPTCKREYPAEKKEELKGTFINNFNEHKESEKQRINKEGQALNSVIEENRNKIEEIQETIQKTEKELLDINTKLEENAKEQSNIGPFDVTKLPQYQEKIKQVEELQTAISKIVQSDTTEISNKKAKLVDQINEIDKKLNERDTQEKTKARIEELEAEEESISQKVQELEAQQYQIEQFTKTKVELLENAINSKFEVVKFRLFDTQINGGLVECCDTLVNGVPYSDVNNAHKILAGLDIINTLIKFYKTSAPIFIDNRESINELYNINTQIISLIVTEDTELRIEVL